MKELADSTFASIISELFTRSMLIVQEKLPSVLNKRNSDKYNIGSMPGKSDNVNTKNDNSNIPKSTSTVDFDHFLNNENTALISCIADALDNTPSKRYQNLRSKGVEVVPNIQTAVNFALNKFKKFVEEKIGGLNTGEQSRIYTELRNVYPEIIASLEREAEYSGNIGLDDVLEKCKKCFCENILDLFQNSLRKLKIVNSRDQIEPQAERRFRYLSA